MTVLVFVYGTLKTGEPNHHLLQNKKRGICRLVGTARTLDKYPLVIATKYNIPFMLYKPGLGHNIEGELYEIDDAQLTLLDDLEKHPHWYERKQVRILQTYLDQSDQSDTSRRTGSTMQDGGPATSREIIVQTYFLVKYQPGLLNLPMYSSYSCALEGKPFLMPSSDDVADNQWADIHTEAEHLMKILHFEEHLNA